MGNITTHILDTSRGKPAAQVPVFLEISIGDNQWKQIGLGSTDNDGRLKNLLLGDKDGNQVTENSVLEEGIYRISFDTATYFKLQDIEGFYPSVSIVFKVAKDEHYHVPLLLNPYGYSTYRGS